VDGLMQLLGGLTGVVVVGLVSAWFVKSGPDALGGMFRPWNGDPWPLGVQEDDDFQWAWRSSRDAEDDTAHETPWQVDVTRVRSRTTSRHT
jgi:hypothetical protein